MLYESVLLFGVVFLAAYLFDTLSQSRHGLHLRTARQCWLLFIIGLYFCWFWKNGGQTLAMKTWRIRLVHQQPDKQLTWRQCIWRFMLGTLCTFTGLGLLYSFFNAKRAWLQDTLTNTTIVLDKPQ